MDYRKLANKGSKVQEEVIVLPLSNDAGQLSASRFGDVYVLSLDGATNNTSVNVDISKELYEAIKHEFVDKFISERACAIISKFLNLSSGNSLSSDYLRRELREPSQALYNWVKVNLKSEFYYLSGKDVVDMAIDLAGKNSLNGKT